MADTINISCPNCETPFEVPVEMVGETVECTECGSVFEILAPDAQGETEAPGTVDNSTVVDGSPLNANDPNSTQTVKMSRTSIGMVPTIEDTYNLDVVDQHVEKTELRKSFESGEYAIAQHGGQTQEGETAPAAEAPAETPVPDKKWWKFWKK